MCVNNFRVHSITLKLLDIFSLNFTQTLNAIRGRAEDVKRNSGFPTLGVIALLCVNNFHVSSITLKPLDIFSQNFTQTLNTIRQRVEHINHNLIFLLFELLPFVCYQFLCLLHNFKTA